MCATTGGWNSCDAVTPARALAMGHVEPTHAAHAFTRDAYPRQHGRRAARGRRPAQLCMAMDYEFDLRELSNAPVREAPWYFRLGRYLSRHRIRGGDRLVIEVRKRGLLDRLAVYSLG